MLINKGATTYDFEQQSNRCFNFEIRLLEWDFWRAANIPSYAGYHIDSKSSLRYTERYQINKVAIVLAIDQQICYK